MCSSSSDLPNPLPHSPPRAIFPPPAVSAVITIIIINSSSPSSSSTRHHHRHNNTTSPPSQMCAFGFVVNAKGVFVFAVFNLNRGAFGRDNTTRVFVSVTATTHQGWFYFGGNEPPPPRGARVVV
ncbi:hypothetical protein Tco_1139766 [Tanacetum coccineum]